MPPDPLILAFFLFSFLQPYPPLLNYQQEEVLIGGINDLKEHYSA